MAADAKAVRRYHAGVERALGLWDASNEWADYIAFLSRLAKALQASPPEADVPFRSTLAKYLALCLKPSLPSGVHQKALEVYNLVFTLLGKNGLARDLSIWFPGVSHTLTFATLSTRPLFLALYDDHFLKLPSQALRPALRAIILSLLPGIEEENGEDFDRTLDKLNRLRHIFAQDGTEEFFWQSLFLSSITSVSRRPGALVYLTRQLPKLGPAPIPPSAEAPAILLEATKAVTTPEPGLLIRCFATGLQDEQPLVQRGFLDLLVSHVPLNAPFLQTHVLSDDLDILVSSAMSVVLRRDMSLNRRLWTWFLGKEDKREGSVDMITTSAAVTAAVTGTVTSAAGSTRHDYFVTYGLKSVTRSLEKMLQKESLSPSDRARPFRIMLSLMDRWVIGKLPVEALFVLSMQDLQGYQTEAPSQASFDEVFRSANVFFDAVEPQLITNQMFQLLARGDLELIEFILANFNLQEDEMVSIHLPVLCLAASELLRDKVTSKQSNSEQGINQPLVQLATLLEAMLMLLPPLPATGSIEQLPQAPRDGWVARLKLLYENSSYTKKAVFDMIPPALSAELLLYNVTLTVLECLKRSDSQPLLGPLTNSFTKAISRTSMLETLHELSLGERLCDSVGLAPRNSSSGYQMTRMMLRMVDTLNAFAPNREVLTESHLLRLVPELLDRLWEVLLPSTPQFHVEAVEQIWNLRMISQHLFLVDSKVVDLMWESETSDTRLEDHLARFSTLWMHTRFPEINAELFTSSQTIHDDDVPWALLRQPVLNIVDSLDPHRPDDRRRIWVSSLPSIKPIFRIVYADSASASDPQLSLLGLHRLYKVLNTARQSNAQRLEFFGSESFSGMILDMCSENLSPEEAEQEPFTMTLSILRLMVEETDIQNCHELIMLLMRQLTKLVKNCALQAEILDTLQVIFGKPNSGSPPTELLHVLVDGVSSKANDSNMDKWVTLLCNTIPLYPSQTLFANLLKLTACFCNRVKDYFGRLQELCESPEPATCIADGDTAAVAVKNPERSINNLLAGLEYILARAHTHLVDQFSAADTPHASATEITQSRLTANSRLTVILCMQDTIKLCGEIWAWRVLTKLPSAAADSKSFAYISSKLRTRTRRMLEHLADAEPQECLETLMGMWIDAARRESTQDVTLNLMQSLDGARPKFMMPATFNAIYNRTNPSALDPSQKSSLSVDVGAAELMAFLIAYTSALEDDLLEEIWTDCTSYLREVLANPMPHRQILLKLLEFVAVMCQKMENTNFGEVSKMRRELGDLCARLFTAIFTIKPAGLDAAPQVASETKVLAGHSSTRSRSALQSGNAIEVICDALPIISNTLGDLDRLNTTLSGIALHITTPALRSKQFPQTATGDILHLVLLMAKSQPNNKTWKKDVQDAFNDAKFFQSSAALAEQAWIPLLRQLSLSEKGLVTELVARLTPPTTAGLMFGVGATAARLEADRKTQLNLRRIAIILLAAEVDAFVPDLAHITRRLEELLTATASSSPSSSTRGDVYLVLRAITLAFSQLQLVSLWPIVDVELRELLTSMQPGGGGSSSKGGGGAADDSRQPSQTFSDYSQLQGAKLLDLLLLLKPEEFQLHEWLFVTDTVDAIYPPSGFSASALADLMETAPGAGPREAELPTTKAAQSRKPWLCTDLTRSMTAEEARQNLLRPFFRQLSIHAFEDTYSLHGVDLKACRGDVLADLFVD